ncbi:minichromosome maintenance domain-containing protein 2-like [Physella acuta]|uniref:minichromosome maintenance domain-containing protein 2-like n=1 Tax=Physella acuta TaxID=109671 RepID=UPI0027DB6760|nr:minichromosome maintenance domain-containing protein 2-like [Physella acuta]
MSSLEHRMSLLRSSLLYLDKHKEFENIKKEAAENKGCFVYTFNINIDLGYIFDQDVSLGHSILTSPLDSSSLFQEIIYHYCLGHQLLPAETTSTQICARLKITNFPSCGMQVFNISDLTKYINYTGLIKLVGVVAGISGSAKYTQSTKYICAVTTCPGHAGNHFIRMHISGASETQTIRNDFICNFCGEILEEVKSLRNLSVKIVVEVIPVHQNGLGKEEIIEKGRKQALTVYVRDELVDVIELGKPYEFIGTIRTDRVGDDTLITVEANNISKLQVHTVHSVGTIPPSLQELFEGCKKSPWSWPINLANRFGDRLVSGGCLIKLRLVLLISLVLNPETHLLHILGIGKETGVFTYLIEYAQKFSRRSFPAVCTTSLSGKVITDKFTWAPYFLESGSLLLSNGGVCSLGDVSTWKKIKREQLQAVLVGNKIYLDLPSKHTGGLAQQLTFPLQCQVWGVYDPTGSGVKASPQKDVFMGSCSTGDLPKGFLDAFNYISFLDSFDSSTDVEIYHDMTTHTLSTWCNAYEDYYKSSMFEDLEKFLSIAKKVETKVSPEAESLLQNYYTASRMARCSGFGGSDVPSSALHSLISLATGFAKLKLQAVVSECDALMAVYLYEESLTMRYGLSVLSIHPQVNVPVSRLSELLGQENDVLMQRFHVQLLKFCSHAIDSRSTQREE